MSAPDRDSQQELLQLSSQRVYASLSNEIGGRRSRPIPADELDRYNHWRHELIEKARSTVDQNARAKMYEEVQTIMAKDPIWIPVANTKEVAVTQRYVHGFSMHPVEYNLDLQKVWLDK